MIFFLALITAVLAELNPFMQNGPPIGRPLMLTQTHPLKEDRYYARVVLMIILISLLVVSMVWTGATYGWIKSSPPVAQSAEKGRDVEDPLIEAVRSFDRAN